MSNLYRFPLKYSANAFNLRHIGQDIFLARSPNDAQSIFLTRIPSSPSQGSIEERKLVLPFQDADFLASSEDNLLVAIERGTE